jgi:ATP-dependent 26S proteasome regulatory subunit
MIETLKNMIKAHYPIVFLQSFEWFRMRDVIKSNFKDQKYAISEWNVAEGLKREQPVAGTEDPVEVIREIFRLATDAEESEKKEIFVLTDFYEYLTQPEVRTRLRMLAYELKYTNKHIILLGSISTIPTELEKEITILEVPLPDKIEIQTALEILLKEINEGSNQTIEIETEIKEKVITAAQGLTIHEADLAFSRAIIECKGFNEDAVKLVVKEKEQIIRKNKVLEYFHTSQTFQDIGGLGNLKKWLQSRSKAFSHKAQIFGLPQPKGILLTGVPGCGKSLTAKAVASLWNMPLLRLDVGKVFEGIVGSSEQNIRKAIMTAEGIAPCVLWLDEIEKGLAGVQSSGASDSGTTARVFATFLSWMQEKTAPVFIIATANNLDALPPELLRKGRFDEIFFVDLPTHKERKDIFRIHVERQKMSLSEQDYADLASESQGFNGSEIEAAIKEAMFIAFERIEEDPETQLTQADILEALHKTVPLSATRKFDIDVMRKIARTRFVMASDESTEEIKLDIEVPLTNSEQNQGRKRNFEIGERE